MGSAAASRAGEDFALIDQNIIERYTQRGPKLIGMLVDAFLEEAPKYFRDIRTGVDANDLSAVRVSAHGLKSCSYNLGAIRLAEFCKDLEAKATQGAATDVETTVELIGPTLFNTEEALKSLRFATNASNA